MIKRKDNEMRRKSIFIACVFAISLIVTGAAVSFGATKEYIVEVYTSNIEYGGTDAGVYIQLIKGPIENEVRSAEIELDNPNKNDFERGNTDRFRVRTEDFGWIDRIRVFHDNKEDYAGWFLNYIKVIDSKAGLEWTANFNRWLSKKDDDGEIDRTSEIPLTVDITDGIIERVYMGYQAEHVLTEGSNPMAVKGEFLNTQKRGVSIDTTTAKSIKTKATLGFNLFAKAEFSLEASYSVAQKLGSQVEETITHKKSWEITVDPNEPLTVVGVLYQDLLVGSLEANGVSVDYSDKFDIEISKLAFQGLLSNAEIEARIQELVRGATGVTVTASAPNTSTPLRTMRPTNINASSIKAARDRMPAIMRKSDLVRFPNARVISSGMHGIQ